MDMNGRITKDVFFHLPQSGFCSSFFVLPSLKYAQSLDARTIITAVWYVLVWGSQPRTGQSTSYGDVKPSYGGAGGWDRRGCATWAPRSANRQGEEQHRHTERGSHTRRDKGECSKQGGGAQQGRRDNQNSGNREPEWSGWQSVRMGGSDNKGDGLASQPRCQGNPCSTGIRWGMSPAAQMGCLRNRSGSPSGADQP